MFVLRLLTWMTEFDLGGIGNIAFDQTLSTSQHAYLLMQRLATQSITCTNLLIYLRYPKWFVLEINIKLKAKSKL